jgi:hypothetical protein
VPHSWSSLGFVTGLGFAGVFFFFLVVEEFVAGDGVAVGVLFFLASHLQPGFSCQGLRQSAPRQLGMAFEFLVPPVLFRNAVRESVLAADFLDRELVLTAEQVGADDFVGGIEFGNGAVGRLLNANFLGEGGDIEILAGFDVVGSLFVGGAGFGDFRLARVAGDGQGVTLLLESDAFAVEGKTGFEILLAEVAVYLRELGELEVFQIVEGTLKGAFGGGAVALHVSEAVEGSVGPEGGIGLSFVEGVLGGVLGANAAPEEPLGVCEVFDEQAGGGGFRGVFGEEGGEEIGEIFLPFAGDDEFLGSAAVNGGVIGGARFAFNCWEGFRLHRMPRFA